MVVLLHSRSLGTDLNLKVKHILFPYKIRIACKGQNPKRLQNDYCISCHFTFSPHITTLPLYKPDCYMELKHTISADMKKHCGSESKLVAKCNNESKYLILLILVTLSGVTQKRISSLLCDVLSYATTYSGRVYVKVVST